MKRRRLAMAAVRKWMLPLLICGIVFPIILFSNLPHQQERFLPRAFNQQQQDKHCLMERSPPLSLDPHSFCSGTCEEDITCFPRLSKGICISSTEARACDPQGVKLPSMLRFKGERVTIPIVEGGCSSDPDRWIEGTSLVADQRFLPHLKPNPHHEAEKLIPAALAIHKLGLRNASLFWFSGAEHLSRWARGLLHALDLKRSIKFVELPGIGDPPICFRDAILFSPPTNVRYVPSIGYNRWLRSSVLRHCNIPIVNASSTPQSALILDRQGPRHLANKDEVAKLVHEILGIPVRIDNAGSGSFCEQVAKVAAEDLVLVPHGSQNVNFLFAPPGQQIIEIFPYLFYNDALANYTHAAELQLHPALGMMPPNNLVIRLFSLFGWDSCYHHLRICKNYARQQLVFADLHNLRTLLLRVTSTTTKIA